MQLENLASQEDPLESSREDKDPKTYLNYIIDKRQISSYKQALS